MKITQALLDNLTEQAKASPRLRMNLDLRNSPEDKSQRMLNAIEPGSPLPIHRHRHSSWTMTQCLFGEHLLTRYPERIVALVEAEKTAVIGAGFIPEYVWLATGGQKRLPTPPAIITT